MRASLSCPCFCSASQEATRSYERDLYGVACRCCRRERHHVLVAERVCLQRARPAGSRRESPWTPFLCFTVFAILVQILPLDWNARLLGLSIASFVSYFLFSIAMQVSVEGFFLAVIPLQHTLPFHCRPAGHGSNVTLHRGRGL